jgi:hypothetical protein
LLPKGGSAGWGCKGDRGNTGDEGVRGGVGRQGDRGQRCRYLRIRYRLRYPIRYRMRRTPAAAHAPWPTGGGGMEMEDATSIQQWMSLINCTRPGSSPNSLDPLRCMRHVAAYPR